MSVSKVFDDLDPILDHQGGLKNPDSAVDELIRYRMLDITLQSLLFYKNKIHNNNRPLSIFPPQNAFSKLNKKERNYRPKKVEKIDNCASL